MTAICPDGAQRLSDSAISDQPTQYRAAGRLSDSAPRRWATERFSAVPLGG
ncbi:hypothetical protein NHF46_03195 [Arthrobacter alpinus]|nr:hypothetical protein [Arthrobacter alpinus]